LHPSPERGIKTITGAKAPESLPAKAHDSVAPPSLLSIRIYAEKESHPALSEISRLTITPFFKLNSLQAQWISATNPAIRHALMPGLAHRLKV
jgi:hypothetical protein